jgi:PAS domain S-box-containing protein
LDFSGLVDTAATLASLFTMIGSGVGVVWLFFRRRLRAWWEPYRQGFEGAAQVPALKSDVEHMSTNLGLLTMHVRARGDIDIEQAQFETDATGANTYVNLTFARWLGVGKAELLGWGWVNFVHPDDRIRVRAEWDACRAEHRKYNIRFRFLDAGGEAFPVDVLAAPIPDSPPAKQWIGVIRRIVQ